MASHPSSASAVAETGAAAAVDASINMTPALPSPFAADGCTNAAMTHWGPSTPPSRLAALDPDVCVGILHFLKAKDIAQLAQTAQGFGSRDLLEHVYTIQGKLRRPESLIRKVHMYASTQRS